MADDPAYQAVLWKDMQQLARPGAEDVGKLVFAIHAGLECGAISAKYPHMDAISIGPTLQAVHTPDERLEIATVKKLYDFLLETLQRIPARGP